MDQQHGNIVQASTSRESAFATKIIDLQFEVRQLKKNEKTLKQESELTTQQFLALQKNHEVNNYFTEFQFQVFIKFQ